MIVEETVRSSTLTHSLLNWAMKVFSKSPTLCCILSRLTIVFFSFQLEAKLDMNSRANSLNDLMEFGLRFAY